MENKRYKIEKNINKNKNTTQKKQNFMDLLDNKKRPDIYRTVVTATDKKIKQKKKI